MDPSDLFRKAVYHLLKEKKMTQLSLAKQLKVSPPNLNDFLKGGRNYSDKKKIKIAEILGTTYVDTIKLGQDLAEGENGQVFDFRELEEQKLFNSFIDPEKARELCSKLKDIEKHCPEGYEDIFDFVKIKHKKIKSNTQKAIKNNSGG
jgi:transcriptional regulator with XRE-family HTH domain